MVRSAFALLPLLVLAGCVAAPPPRAPAPRPAPPAPALPAAPPQQDWRDVPLTPGDWRWQALPGRGSIAQFGPAGQAALVALRCDPARRVVQLSRAGALAASGMLAVTTSFGRFAVPAGNGGGTPPAIIAQFAAADARLDQLAFSRGRFLLDAPGQPQLVVPAWPEVARVIEDCR
ncbi:hypothetical protein [Sphingomonas morindae]|uniref:Lipoprotein n=1 Tax=Sphingomonas morindae TaxID=1541170 RepID=A0ABY4XB88_9SPHN|nr:hypothetical protein [Sphingomonas morindae]USI74104.1 hypothetical protein LHA26_06490 [Sphingomonas morindae]